MNEAGVSSYRTGSTSPRLSSVRHGELGICRKKPVVVLPDSDGATRAIMWGWQSGGI